LTEIVCIPELRHTTTSPHTQGNTGAAGCIQAQVLGKTPLNPFICPQTLLFPDTVK